MTRKERGTSKCAYTYLNQCTLVYVTRVREESMRGMKGRREKDRERETTNGTAL